MDVCVCLGEWVLGVMWVLGGMCAWSNVGAWGNGCLG